MSISCVMPKGLGISNIERCAFRAYDFGCTYFLFWRNQLMSFPVLSYAKSKILEGDFNMAASYYNRARSEGVANCVVDLRYLTKEYLVYPIEYEGASNYFELLKQLKNLAETNDAYMEEYQVAINSLYDIRRLFLRALALFYFSDILVSSPNSVVLCEIAEIQRYIKENKDDILEKDIYELNKFIPKYNKKKFARDLNIIEAYCMNILLSYTAEQHSIYQGKRYSATTVDYGYFYSTTIRETDRYYNFANIKPRLFLLGYEAYYHDIHRVYKNKLREIGGFDSPKELKKELTRYVQHKDKKDVSAKEFLKYMKHFEKDDSYRMSYFGTMREISKKINPLVRLDTFTDKMIENNVGSFELNEYFPQKKIAGVCSMLAAGQGWNVTTVRAVMVMAAAFAGLGALIYIVLAIAKKLGFYFGVNIQKP